MKRASLNISRDLDRPIGLLLLFTGIILFLILVYHYNFTQDDTFISFRYVENYVNGHGLVFNTGERIEGYTNFLWTIILVIGRIFGLNLILFSKFLGITCGLGTIIITFLLGQSVFKNNHILSGSAALLLGASYSFAYWAGAGLETSAFALAVLAAFYAYQAKSHLTGPILLIAALLRPEGFLVIGFIIIFDLVRFGKIRTELIVMVVIIASGILPYLIFKLTYYGSLLPNTFFAKSGGLADNIPNGLEYIGRYFWHYLGAGLFLLPVVISLRRADYQIVGIFWFFIVYSVYILLIGGDVLRVHRFFICLSPIVSLLIVYGISKLSGRRVIFVVSMLLVLVWQGIIPREYINDYNRAEKALVSKMKYLGQELLQIDSSDFSVAASTIGALGYTLYGHDVIDMLGLTDSTIARHPEQPIAGMKSTWKERRYNSVEVLKRSPDYILFSTGYKPSAPAERALFLYSEFLQNYRTVGFYFEGDMRDIFKKIGRVGDRIVRDTDSRFVGYYVEAIDSFNIGEYRAADSLLDLCERLIPISMFPYVRYGRAGIWMKNRHVDKWIGLVKTIIPADTFCYQAYRDLYIYEYSTARNYEAADKYRNRLENLVPWYLPYLDSLVKRP